MNPIVVEYETQPHNRVGRLVWESPKGRRVYLGPMWGDGGPDSIQSHINSFLIDAERVLGLANTTEEPDITLRISESDARILASCQEYRHYLYGARVNTSDPLFRKYGLAPHLYGLKIELVNIEEEADTPIIVETH